LARLESCFHYEHISLPRPATTSKQIQHRFRRRLQDRNQGSQQPQGDATKSTETVTLQNSHPKVIEIQSDPEEEEGAEESSDGEDITMLDEKPRQELSYLDSKPLDPPSSSMIDLTMTSSDEDSSEDDNDTEEEEDKPQQRSHSQKRPSSSSSIGRRGPKIILRVDTSLLKNGPSDVGGLIDIIGEVMYDHGHWVLQARTVRSMEGLDLYTYRQSILLTRSLVESTKSGNNNNHEQLRQVPAE
jgi:hypothetical protein